MNWENDQTTRIRFIFMVLIPIFMMVSVSSSKIYDAYKQDFAAYWQAGHMILSGQDVYSSSEWIAERELRKTALHSEPTFHYPLPFAVLFSPLALLPVQTAYTVWLFFEQIAMLIAIFILLSFYPVRTGYIELLTVAGIFLFRPSVSVIFNGQILSLLFLLVCISLLLLHKKYWFWGGFVLSILSLKPSIGIPILALAGIWLLSKKQWNGVLGIAAGGVTLFLTGALVNPGWVIDYINIGGDSFSKYFGLHPTLWGVVDKIFIQNSRSFIVGSIVVFIVFAIEAYFFWGKRFNSQPLDAFASILPAGLLIAPYSWNYDQILLAVPLLFIMIRLSSLWGHRSAIVFLFGMVGLAIGLVYVAYALKHDVWSFLNSFIVWICVLYFVINDSQVPQTTSSAEANGAV